MSKPPSYKASPWVKTTRDDGLLVVHILGWKCLTLGLLQDHRVQCTVWVPSNIFSRDPAIARIWPCIFSNQSPAPFLSYSSVWILSSDHPGNKNPLTGFYLVYHQLIRSHSISGFDHFDNIFHTIVTADEIPWIKGLHTIVTADEIPWIKGRN